MSAPQQTYRLYCYDGARKIVSAHWLDATSDEEAIAEAREGGFGSNCEIWEGTRMVAHIEDELRTG